MKRIRFPKKQISLFVLGVILVGFSFVSYQLDQQEIQIEYTKPYIDRSPAFAIKIDVSVDSDSDIDATANIGDDGATSYLDAQTVNAVDQVITEGQGTGYVAGVDNENDIDNDASDVDGVTDIGTQGTFSNAQGTNADTVYMNIQEGNGAGYSAPVDTNELHDAITDTDSGTNPDLGTYDVDSDMLADDGTMNTLTEENTGGGGGDDALYPTSFDSTLTEWTESGCSGSAYTCIDAQGDGESLTGTSGGGGGTEHANFGFSGASGNPVTYVNITIYHTTGENTNIEVTNSTTTVSFNFGSGSGWETLTVDSDGGSAITTLPTQAEINGATIEVIGKSQGGAGAISLDALYIGYDWGGGGDNYEFDREFQFQSIGTLDGSVERLDINTGTMGTEDLIVQIWEASSWTTVVTLVDANDGVWINTSITTWLDSATEYFRFLGGTEISDTTSNTWEIDMVLIHIEKTEVLDYELNFEYQWTTADATQTNEEVSIWVGTRSDAENIVVDYWSGSWTNIGTINAVSTHFNFTATGLTTTYTLRFTGSTESGDSTQTNWDIDLITLHTWTDVVNDYELSWEHQATSLPAYSTDNAYYMTILGYYSATASETVGVEMWNTSSSAWIIVSGFSMTITEQWYNVSIDCGTIGICSTTMTWQFFDDDRSLDSDVDTLNIDYAGIYIYSLSMTLTETTGDIPIIPDSTDYAMTENPFNLVIDAGENFDIQIRGTDTTGTPIASNYVWYDSDNNPAGYTQLTTSWTTLYSNQDLSTTALQFWLWSNIAPPLVVQTLDFTLEVRIIIYVP